MRILLDTNIVLDFLLMREPHAAAAVKIFESLSTRAISGYVTANTLTDIFYILSKRLGHVTARAQLRHLFNLVGVISVTEKDCLYAFDLPMSDFEDALVITCALKQSLDYIVTNDSEFLDTTVADVSRLSGADFNRFILNE